MENKDRRKIVSVIGNKQIEKDGVRYRLAFEIGKALVDNGFDGYVRPDHGRMVWGETGKPGYGLFDRALGATYINGLFEACEKAAR